MVYLIIGFRWSFFGKAGIGVSLGMSVVSVVVCLAAITWIFKTGYWLKR